MISRRDLILGPLAAGLIASPLQAVVRFDRRTRGFDIAVPGAGPTPILTDPADHKGVLRAARDLAADIGRVTGTPATVLADKTRSPRRAIIAGSLDSSPLIRSLVQTGAIDVATIQGKWEAYSLQTVTRPMPGIDEALVIVGADKRGTIYGIYDLSQNIGVSPWYWFADVPVVRGDRVRVAYGNYVQGSPAVRLSNSSSRWRGTRRSLEGENRGLDTSLGKTRIRHGACRRDRKFRLALRQI